MVGQWIIHDRVLGDFGQRDVLRHVLQVGAVVLAHDEKLAAVAEYGGTDARLFEPCVLLHDGNVPAVELAKLRVALLDDFLPPGMSRKRATSSYTLRFRKARGSVMMCLRA